MSLKIIGMVKKFVGIFLVMIINTNYLQMVDMKKIKQDVLQLNQRKGEYNNVKRYTYTNCSCRNDWFYTLFCKGVVQ